VHTSTPLPNSPVGRAQALQPKEPRAGGKTQASGTRHGQSGTWREPTVGLPYLSKQRNNPTGSSAPSTGFFEFEKLAAPPSLVPSSRVQPPSRPSTSAAPHRSRRSSRAVRAGPGLDWSWNAKLTRFIQVAADTTRTAHRAGFGSSPAPGARELSRKQSNHRPATRAAPPGSVAGSPPSACGVGRAPVSARHRPEKGGTDRSDASQAGACESVRLCGSAGAFCLSGRVPFPLPSPSLLLLPVSPPLPPNSSPRAASRRTAE
jgi:hypothetical protein